MRNSHVGHSGDLAEGSRLGNSFAATTEVSWLLTSEIPDDALDFETAYRELHIGTDTLKLGEEKE
jgi:hypothetical protein